MLSIKSITPKEIKELQRFRFILFIPLFCIFLTANSQDNSPYSRYGIGNMVPSTNITSRGMGGLTAGYWDYYAVNMNNPASYSSFRNALEKNKKKSAYGRIVMDLGMNFDSRTLKEKNNPLKFTTGNAFFSYMQMGIPIKKNWGISFGLRPISRIGYKVSRNEMLIDPNTQLPIDSTNTLFEGDGGVYLPSFGTGYKFNNFSVGFNVGYLFGKKNYSTRRGFYSDTIQYYQSNHENKTTFGKMFFNAGMQYKIDLAKQVALTLGAYGNLQQKLKASQDIIRETFVRDALQGDIRIDSVYEQRNINGSITYPASYGIGFMAEKIQEGKKSGWLLGMDFVHTSWDKYRFYGLKDSLNNSWEIRTGGQIQPAPQKSYFSKISYQAGFFFGQDNIKVNNKLPQYGVSFGMRLPVVNYNRLSLNQVTFLNLAFEYIKRGNNQNLLRENLFRMSASFSLTDLWFNKRKYE